MIVQALWDKLIMANYVTDPAILQPFVPFGTLLDSWGDQCYLSLVGFLFLDSRLNGMSIPFHGRFEEVNLRFYVYREEDGQRKRGVVFIRELVPKPAVTFVANKIYHEHYKTAAMRHQWELQDDHWQISYQWKESGWHTLQIKSLNKPFPLVEGSKEEFFTEHYWGYTQRKQDQTLEYFVDHHPWQLYPTVSYKVEVDFEENYGKPFRFLNEQIPDTIFLAEGSDIALQKSKVIRSG